MITTSQEGGVREWTLRRDHNAISDACRFAEVAIGNCSPECKDAVAVAVTELAENLVKYCTKDPTATAGTIAVGVSGNGVKIRATNLVGSGDDAQQVMKLIARIAASNPMELYRARLQELFANPGLPRAQLGLLRIAFEGRFQLSCSFRQSVLEITAERACPRAEH